VGGGGGKRGPEGTSYADEPHLRLSRLKHFFESLETKDKRNGGVGGVSQRRSQIQDGVALLNAKKRGVR